MYFIYPLTKLKKIWNQSYRGRELLLSSWGSRLYSDYKIRSFSVIFCSKHIVTAYLVPITKHISTTVKKDDIPFGLIYVYLVYFIDVK